MSFNKNKICFLVLLVSFFAFSCSKDKGKDKKTETPDSPSPAGEADAVATDKDSIPARDEQVQQSQAPVYMPQITVGGVLFSNYYNRATASPYFQSSTELKDLFPDISNPKTSQLCLPTIMSYELYTQLTAKPSILSPQAEAHLMKPVTEQVREMYRVCETDRFRGTTAPQAANCAVKAAYATGLKPQVHVIGLDAKWKEQGYYIDSVSVDVAPIQNKDIIEAVANRISAMFLIGFYETKDGINFERIGGHFISMTATGEPQNHPGIMRVWIVDPANPGNEKSGTENPFNGTIQAISRPEATNLDPLITKELIDSQIESAGLRIFIESEIRYSLSRE